MLGIDGNDTDIGKPDVLPTFHLPGVRKCLGRDRLFRTEIRSTINDLHVYCSINSTVVPIERANQYAASPADKALGNTTSLVILPALVLVFDPNEQGSLR